MAGSSTIGYLEWNPNFYMLALSSSIALSILSLSLFRLSLFRILRAENRRSTETCVGGSAVRSSATSLNSAKENMYLYFLQISHRHSFIISNRFFLLL